MRRIATAVLLSATALGLSAPAAMAVVEPEPQVETKAAQGQSSATETRDPRTADSAPAVGTRTESEELAQEQSQGRPEEPSQQREDAAARSGQPDEMVGVVTPNVVKPGGRVSLVLRDCDRGTATADSDGAFGEVTLNRQDGLLTGSTTVSDDVQGGAEHTVKVRCGDHSTTARLTIAQHPSHGTRGGLGGGLGRMNSTEVAFGATVLAAAAAGGTVALRRRSRDSA
ncbi:hypothetical protein [Wenjunlia tyrosinilytica]|uniref:Uncharacterized protein n=1 Tax=Wenjunlia tyrosinilytica TaxID=1544741 RepID=A0A917ZSJ4_9ACTN|nr:hypothetical protein [Wenjunlia tyrosinilytica]GGO89773.1 hypothetical protein GCM10012280_33790 [Wenjunlia tyrosinilytica]